MRLPDKRLLIFGGKKHTENSQGPWSKKKTKWRSEKRTKCGGCWVISERKEEERRVKVNIECPRMSFQKEPKSPNVVLRNTPDSHLLRDY